MTKKPSAERMWQSLEEKRQMPAAADLKYLSGLLEDDIRRLATIWPELPLDVRQQLTQTLASVAEADFEMDFSAVFRLALEDTDAEVRVGAIEGLCEDEDVRLVSCFVKILKGDAAVAPRVAAAEALARFVLMGELQQIRNRPFERALAALIEAHTNANEAPEVRQRALESLAYTNINGVPEMIEAAYTHTDEKTRISAVFAMGRSADKRWAEIVKQELASPIPAMRFEATRASGELQLREVIHELVELVEDVDPEIQAMALWSLGQIGGDLARYTLMRYARSKNEALKVSAREAMDELEFLHGDLSSFFGPPEDFYGDGDLTWEEEDALAKEFEDDEDNELWIG